MRLKLLLCFAVALFASLTASADFAYLLFETSDGSQTTIRAQGVSITVDGNKLVAVNSENETFSSELSELTFMQFTDTQSAVADVEVSSDTSVTVFNLDGTKAGSFGSFVEAHKTLTPGVYILQNSNGKTVKIAISK